MPPGFSGVWMPPAPRRLRVLIHVRNIGDPRVTSRTGFIFEYKAA